MAIPYSMVHNFNAGPSILPAEVFEQAAEAIHDFNGTGLSILEVGHRTPVFEAVMQEALSLSRELMHLSDDKEVMFLHGGATTQFLQGRPVSTGSRTSSPVPRTATIPTYPRDIRYLKMFPIFI